MKRYPKTSKYGIPHFDSFACVGDYVEWTPKTNNPHSLTLRVTIHQDHDTQPTDFDDCYSSKKIESWRNDDWFFCGIVISAYKGDTLIHKHASSLWGIDCNFNRRSNTFLATCCADLQDEALDAAHAAFDTLIKACTNATTSED